MQETVRTSTATSSNAASPRPGLRSVADTLVQLLAAARPLAGRESVDTMAARGRVLATPLTAALDVPAADNAQMDGYAVRRADLAAASDAAPVALPVSQRIPAGHPAGALEAGTVARIFTGALVPPGADAVVMQEDVDVVDGRARFRAAPPEGEWIRRRGEDIAKGRVILSAGTRLDPQHLGLAASIGAARVEVAARPRVAIFSTGDELAMPGDVAPEDLAPGTIFNSNRFTLRNLVETFGCTCVDLGIVPDTLAATRAALVRAAASADVIVTSGGVSVGEEDHLRPAVAAEGHVDLWQIALKPGKPFAFGRVGGVEHSAHFVGLPGNPVSGFVTFLVLVRPLLLRLAGVDDVAPRAVALRADFDWPRPDKRQEFLRARINADGGLDCFPNQGSAVLTSTTWADGLIDNPAGQAIRRGDTVRFLPFADLFR
jgi:molybdopterin molybdotransferase